MFLSLSLNGFLLRGKLGWETGLGLSVFLLEVVTPPLLEAPHLHNPILLDNGSPLSFLLNLNGGKI